MLSLSSILTSQREWRCAFRGQCSPSHVLPAASIPGLARKINSRKRRYRGEPPNNIMRQSSSQPRLVFSECNERVRRMLPRNGVAYGQRMRCEEKGVAALSAFRSEQLALTSSGMRLAAGERTHVGA
ncbi:hypothetical protein MRX96_009818 [Rhipicephalus microplus]